MHQSRKWMKFWLCFLLTLPCRLGYGTENGRQAHSPAQEEVTTQVNATFKIVFSGDLATGKSSLLLKAKERKFLQKTATTVGLSMWENVYPLTIRGELKTVKLKVWDTAGQERFQAITHTYFRDTDAVIFVYDITRPDSFRHIKEIWDPQAKANLGEDVYYVLIGNKRDLVPPSTPALVSTRAAQKLYESNGYSWFLEQSAKDDDIGIIFEQLADRLYREYDKKERQAAEVDQDVIRLRSDAPQVPHLKSTSSCCTL